MSTCTLQQPLLVRGIYGMIAKQSTIYANLRYTTL